MIFLINTRAVRPLFLPRTRLPVLTLLRRVFILRESGLFTFAIMLTVNISGGASMNHPFTYEIIYSPRRTTALQVTPDGRVIVRAPKRCPRSFIEAFVRQKEDWVLRQLARFEKQRKEHPPAEQPPLSDEDRARYIRHFIISQTNNSKIVYKLQYSIKNIGKQCYCELINS